MFLFSYRERNKNFSITTVESFIPTFEVTNFKQYDETSYIIRYPIRYGVGNDCTDRWLSVYRCCAPTCHSYEESIGYGHLLVLRNDILHGVGTSKTRERYIRPFGDVHRTPKI
jgi:hypothetical protein